MNRRSIVITLCGLLLGVSTSTQARDYYIVATGDAMASTEHNLDMQPDTNNVIAVWSDDTLCNRSSANNAGSENKVEHGNVVTYKRSMIAPRMARNLDK